MIQDIYIKSPEDPNFVYGVLHHNDPIESIISKIKVILSTRKGEVLGAPSFGVGIEDLIFETKINKITLEESIISQINQYVDESARYTITPSVSFGKTDSEDFAIIDILINDQKVIGILVS